MIYYLHQRAASYKRLRTKEKIHVGGQSVPQSLKVCPGSGRESINDQYKKHLLYAENSCPKL